MKTSYGTLLKIYLDFGLQEDLPDCKLSPDKVDRIVKAIHDISVQQSVEFVARTGSASLFKDLQGMARKVAHMRCKLAEGPDIDWSISKATR